MKKVVMLILFILSCISYVNAQAYNEYFSIARRHLTNGDIEKAQKVDAIILQSARVAGSFFWVKWERRCHIIPLDETTMIVMHKIPAEQLFVS